MLSFTIQPEFNLKALTLLYDDPDLGFQFLTDLTGVHYPEREGQELAVVYHLHNLVKNVRIRMKIYVPVAKPDVYTATGLFSGANWMERETYDFFGINFIGHPDLRIVSCVSKRMGKSLKPISLVQGNCAIEHQHTLDVDRIESLLPCCIETSIDQRSTNALPSMLWQEIHLD
jgi:hypothetical protein